MEIIADILLIGGAFAATAYCIVLSRRLKRFTDLEKGVGGAITVLSAQVDGMTKTLKSAQKSAAGSAQSLDLLTGKAEGVARRLELMVASLHDLPESRSAGSFVTGNSSTDNPDKKEAPATKESAEDSEIVAQVREEPLFLSQRAQIREAAE